MNRSPRSSTRATRATTACATCSPPREPKKRQRRSKSEVIDGALMIARARAIAACLALSAISLSAQKPAEYKAPRTPWGDPDLQGNYTNLSEAGTPMERPAEYIGKNMNAFSRDELADIE